MKTKVCCTCKVEKGIEGFSKNKSTKDGYKQYCKVCAKGQTERYREKYRDEINERNKDWYYDSKAKKEARTQKALESGAKTCTLCGIQKDVRSFYERGNGGFYGECKECHNEKVKIYVNENRERVLNRKKKYYLRTRENHLEYFKKYNIRNSERNIARVKEWAANNPEKFKQIKVMTSQRRRAKLANVKSDFTRKEWDHCKNYFRDKDGLIECAYCEKKLKNATQEHFIAIHRGGEHTAANILPICKSCNSRKSAADFYEWYPSMPFYSKRKAEKIHKYFNSLKQNHDNHEPSALETV